MMEKIPLIVLGLSASPASNNAYALILKESEGERRLPIIIGAFEAQSIALEMEEIMPPRPMTHDLVKTLVDSLGITLTYVHINDLQEGTFYSKLVFEEEDIEIDARPSDAIAIAVRLNAPIYVDSNIIDATGIYPQQDAEFDAQAEDLHFNKKVGKTSHKDEGHKSKIEKLYAQLDKAITDEDYELAASIRDEIQKNVDTTKFNNN